MDTQDRPFPMVDLVKKYPAIFKAIGESKFISKADEFGLSWFSPATIAQFPARNLARFIKNKADLKLVPPEKLVDIQFVLAVIDARGGEAVQWFPSKFVFAEATELASQRPACFRYLPKTLQTQELADTLATGADWRNIEKNIPLELRSPAIDRQYWRTRCADTYACPPLAEVPEAFQADCAVPCLTKQPKDIPVFAALLDEKKPSPSPGRTSKR